METNDLLPTLAEISVTLAALSGVAGVLGLRSDDSGQEVARILLRDVAGLGLAVALLSLAPLIVGGWLGAGVAWRLLSAVAAAFWVALFLSVLPKLWRHSPARKTFVFGPPITAVGLVLLLWNIVAPDAASPDRYVGALLCMLIIAGSNFLFAVFKPTAG